jgi:diguanylate cyclase (GGDEF)-like protein/PAS domain S-box-containing protein
MTSLSSTTLRRSSVLIPYWVCCGLVLALLPINAKNYGVEVGIAIVLQLVVGVTVTRGQYAHLGRWVAYVGIATYMVSVALLRDGVGSTGGYGSLVLLPVMWAALHNRRSELWFAVLAAGAVYTVPLVLVGGDAYPVSGWRSGILITVIAASLGSGVAYLVPQLQAEADRSGAILTTMSEGFALVREDEIIAVNPALSTMTGFSEEQLLGSRVPFPFWPDAATDDPATPGEATLQRADGARFPASIRSAPSLLPDGSRVVVTTIRDITAEKAHELAIIRRADDLAGITAVTQAVSHSSAADARKVISQVAVDITGASGAVVWELALDGSAASVTAAGLDLAALAEIGSEPSLAVRHAMNGDASLLVSDAATSPLCNSAIVRQVGAESVLFQSIRTESRVHGVLAVYWSERRDEISDECQALLTVLADEAAVALERADLLRQLENLSRTDELTGLPNRRAWTTLLEREMKVARRSSTGLSVAMLDLDHFKRYNDLHGHIAGDRLLQAAATAWRSALRQTDMIARWGGEEFVALLPNCDAENACRLVQRLQGTLPDGVTFSAGVADWDGISSVDEFTGTADDALYAAKHGGRDRIETKAVAA